MNRRRLRLLAAAIVLTGLAAPVAARSPNLARAEHIAARLDRTWGETGGWRGINPWQRFVIADGLIDLVQRTGQRRLIPRIESVVANRQGLDGNDDDLWAVLAQTHLAEVDRNPALLATARATFDGIVADYWDEHCGGGLWWDHQRTYKNAITNELLILAAADLHKATGDPVYRDWAERGWRWFAASGMIGVNGLINDGLDAACRNNGHTTYTYNQGVILGGLLSLHAITGDGTLIDRAVAIARSATVHLSDPQGILREPVSRLDVDGPMFKGILVFHLGHLVAVMPHGADRDRLQHFLRHNARKVWAKSKGGRDPVAARWEGPDDATSATAEASGMDLFIAASR